MFYRPFRLSKFQAGIVSPGLILPGSIWIGISIMKGLTTRGGRLLSTSVMIRSAIPMVSNARRSYLPANDQRGKYWELLNHPSIPRLI